MGKSRIGKEGLKPLSQNFLVRLVVLSPLLLSGAAALLLLGAALFAWGVADEYGLGAWVPTASGLVIAVPVLLTSAYGILSLRGRLSGLFEVDVMSAVVGGVSHWTAAVSLVILSGTMTSEASYRSLGASTSSAGFFFLASTAAVVGCFLLLGMTLVYVSAITPGRKTHLGERSAGEVDFVEQWGRRRRS